MSRIHDILSKAERDGNLRRTHVPEAAASDPSAVTATVAEPPSPSGLSHVPRRRSAPADAPPGPRRVIDAGHMSPLLVAALAPHAPIAEQYRTLRTRIMLGEDGTPRRVVLVSSPGAGDGKSITATNLALTMAQEFNRKIVLVDADLRQPGTHHLLGLPQTPGLSEVLDGSVSLEEALVELPEFNLWVLPAGVAPERPAELLGSLAMRRALDALRTRFDRVVLDMPPAVPLADVGVLAPHVDGVLLIVRAGVTTKPQIERALATFDPHRLMGLVLNASGGSPTAYDSYAGTAASA
jgi:capsular exopolysaccharide synthesis family protein